MCTYLTETRPLAGSAKAAGGGWFSLSLASVYLDHPVHVPLEHALCIDLLDPAAGPSARVGVELDEASARALAEAILAALERGGRNAGRSRGVDPLVSPAPVPPSGRPG